MGKNLVQLNESLNHTFINNVPLIRASCDAFAVLKHKNCKNDVMWVVQMLSRDVVKWRHDSIHSVNNFQPMNAA